MNFDRKKVHQNAANLVVFTAKASAKASEMDFRKLACLLFCLLALLGWLAG